MSTVTARSKRRSTSIVSPVAYAVPPADANAASTAFGPAATRTATSAVAAEAPAAPAAVTVRRNTWAPSSPVTGAVKAARATAASVSDPPAPPVRDQEYVTLVPQGSSKPFSAPSAPRVTRPPEATSIPPAGPAFAVGTKRALPGLSDSLRKVSPVTFSKIRGGSDERLFPCRWMVKDSPVNSSNTPGAIVCRSLSSRKSWVSVSSSPSNTLAGSAVRSLSSSVRNSIPPRFSKSPRFRTAMPLLSRSRYPASASKCVVVTSEQVLTLLSFAMTRSSSSSRTWGVRAQMPLPGVPSDWPTL